MAAAEEAVTAAVEQADNGAAPEHAPNWIVSKTPRSAFSVLQLGYELKKNGEQNAERARRTPDNVYTLPLHGPDN
jgi:hypothetical protein